MTTPLMPKATAVWLIDNTTLTFKQIADFCTLHELEVQGIADGDVASGIIGEDPVANGQITQENLDAAIKDPSVSLELTKKAEAYAKQTQAKGKYTPVARRQDKPDAIAWLLKSHPDFTDAQIGKLVGTTKKTIEAIRNKTHWNSSNIRPRDPVLLGLCTQTDLQTMVVRAEKRRDKEDKQQTSSSEGAGDKDALAIKA